MTRLARWTSATAVGFLAVDGEQTVGLAVVLLGDPQVKLAKLYSMWVAPEYRGQGIGRMLVNASVAWAQATGIQTLGPEVSSDNAAASDFYSKLGFVFTGASQPHPHMAGLCALEMVRDIATDSR